MPFVTQKSLVTVALLAGIAGLALGAFIWSGMYNVGADDPHLRPTYTMLRLMRERSILRHTRAIEVPPLDDPALIRQGAGNYDAMCAGCHLAPGRGATELSKGLYPSPPNFSGLEPVNPAHAFWVTKHGIKASGMPAWGRSMDDKFIWGMVAFLQALPTLDAPAYRALVASSGGHSHGGGETPSRQRAETSEPHAHASGIAPTMVEHRHADGTLESHPAPTTTEADDHHEHQH